MDFILINPYLVMILLDVKNNLD